jgi:hypothetical protein
MQAITTVGLDIAKSVFQVHGIDAAGKVLVRRQLKRRQVLPALPGAEVRQRRSTEHVGRRVHQVDLRCEPRPLAVAWGPSP